MFDLVSVKLMYQSGLVAVAAPLSELSRCSSEIPDEILLLCFFFDNSCSQMHALPKSSDMNEAWVWSEGYLSLVREVLWKSGKEIQSHLWVEYLIAILHIQFENLQINAFMLTENGVENIPKNWWSFWQSWNPILKFLYQNRKQGAYFSLFPEPCIANTSKGIQLLAITWVGAALWPPHALVSTQTVPGAAAGLAKPCCGLDVPGLRDFRGLL